MLQRVLRERPLRRETPGLMYRVIDLAYKAVSGLAVVSYMGLIFLMISMPPRREPGSMPILEWIVGLLMALCAQSVYFGVLIRDLAELGAEHVAHALGYTKKDDDEGDAADPPRGMCALCATYLAGWDPASTSAAASRVGSSFAAGGGGIGVARGSSTDRSSLALRGSFDADGSFAEDAESSAAAPLPLDSDESGDEGDLHPFGDAVEARRHAASAAAARAVGLAAGSGRSAAGSAGISSGGRGSGRNGTTNKAAGILRVRAPDGSAVFRLPCNHEFHETCLKGWVLIGKKNRCPCCSERVELAAITGRTLLGKPTLLWANLLTVARYLVVWLPLLLLLSRFFLYEAGVQLLPPGHTHSPPPIVPAELPPVVTDGAHGSIDDALANIAASGGPPLVISG